jgi:hypothetical protein
MAPVHILKVVVCGTRGRAMVRTVVTNSDGDCDGDKESDRDGLSDGEPAGDWDGL